MANKHSTVTAAYTDICDVGDSIIIDPETNVFQFRGQRLHLIYPGLIPKFMIIDHITEVVKNGGRAKNHGIEFIRCTHVTPSYPGGNHRTHVSIDFGRLWRCVICDKLDFDGIIPHWKAVKRVNHWNCLLDYMAREDPENADLMDMEREDDEKFTPTLEEIRGMPLDSAYNALGGNPLHYNAIKKIQEDSQPTDITPFIFDPEEHRWSYKVLSLINKTIDQRKGENRKIHWIYSCRGGANGDGGGTGKSSLGSWMEEKFPNWLYLDETGRCTDMIRIIQNEWNIRGWDKKTNGVHGIYIDLDRSAESHNDLYRLLEKISNRKLSAAKYDSSKITLRHWIHIVVVANWPPRLAVRDANGFTRQTLSSDRFNIWEIINDHHLRHVDTNKLLDYQLRMINRSPMELVTVDERGFKANEYQRDDIDLFSGIVESPTSESLLTSSS